MSKRLALLCVGLIGILVMGACTGGAEEPDGNTPEPTAGATDTGATATPGGGGPVAGEPVFGGQFETHSRGEPRGGFEPHMPGGLREKRMLLSMFLEGTVARLDSTDAKCDELLTPWLAESWGYVDDTTFEIKVRPGVMWQDVEPLNGRPLVAQDIAFSFQRLIDMGVVEAVREITESIEVVDEETVHINLTEPYPGLDIQFLALSQTVIVAEEALNAAGEFDRTSAIGTGPYIMESYDPASGVQFVRNDNYWWDDRPYIETVQMRFMGDKSTRLAAFEAGQLDVLDELSPSEVSRAKNTRPTGQYYPCVSSMGMM
ncbi:MAG: ABC transporter substrate-binding protein, partial [Dehalococcoidia bacterium]